MNAGQIRPSAATRALAERSFITMLRRAERRVLNAGLRQRDCVFRRDVAGIDRELVSLIAALDELVEIRRFSPLRPGDGGAHVTKSPGQILAAAADFVDVIERTPTLRRQIDALRARGWQRINDPRHLAPEAV